MVTTVSYQGEPGAFSHLACQAVFEDVEAMACPTFESAMGAVERGEAERAMIPVENSVAGRVADIHRLLPDSKLFVVAEHFQPVAYDVLAPAGATLDTIKTVASHPMALAQCRRIITQRNWRAIESMDTAGAAREAGEREDPGHAALASPISAELYGLQSLATRVQDDPHNMTRFVVMSALPQTPELGSGPCVTALLFRVRNVPASLYKVLGGFATNGVNITKLESYIVGGDFNASQFFAEVEGHPDEAALSRALEEMSYFSAHMRTFGTYPAHPVRLANRR